MKFIVETMRKFGLCHFLGRKMCGNLNFVIFYVGKSAESWTLLFLLAKKVRKVESIFPQKNVFFWPKKITFSNFPNFIQH
jgi:hypothetical protein